MNFRRKRDIFLKIINCTYKTKRLTRALYKEEIMNGCEPSAWNLCESLQELVWAHSGLITCEEKIPEAKAERESVEKAIFGLIEKITDIIKNPAKGATSAEQIGTISD